MLGPAFSEMRRSEELLDQRAVRSIGIARVIGHETVGAFGRGQQTRERDRGAAEEGARRGGLRVGQTLLGQLREEEGVDRAARRDRRNRRADHRLKRPMVGDRLSRDGCHLAGPDGAFGNPTLEEGELGGREPVALRRHADIRFVGAQDQHQMALGRVAGHHRGLARVAAREQGLASVDPEAGFLLFGPMAFQAALRKDGLDLRLEVDRGDRGGSDEQQRQPGRSESVHRLGREIGVGHEREAFGTSGR